ncbi:hypothetical protein EJB05_33956 [Eragrostis curvula]|uniref:KIB1-4 beta-propeller domain-containing protein n=1 Tax=Eragrostis curvula TaxID=38414 RepID=A0A5J9U2Y5_9POAL|nr:hypothetical protein EJB05_33956 [Eragrostis curvula]
MGGDRRNPTDIENKAPLLPSAVYFKRDKMQEQDPSNNSGSLFELASALPILVHDLGTRDGSQTQYSISKQALFSHGIDELRDYRCFETPQGWMLAVDRDSLKTFLWRPQDSKRIQLPPLEEDFPNRCKCVLSDTPIAQCCSVLVFDLDDTQMWVCQIGASKWDSFSYNLTMSDARDNDRETHIAKCHGVTAVGGKVYYELTGYELGIMEFDPAPSLGTINVDMVDWPRSMPMGSTYLIESCGELFLIIIFFDGDNVHKIAEFTVYKMDFSKPGWCRVNSIGDDRVFLLGGDRIGLSNFGASCPAAPENGLCGNTIYFLNHLAITENFLHVMDLEKGTEEVQRPFRDKGFDNDYHEPLRPPFWLLPIEP